MAAFGIHRNLSHGVTVKGSLEGEFTGSHQIGVNGECSVFRVGEVFDLADIGFGGKLQPYGLPDAGGTGVHAAVRAISVALLPGRNHGTAGIILRMNGNDVFPGFHKVGNVHCEGDVSAFVAAAFAAVDVNGGTVIHRTEMENNTPLKLFFCQGEAALVPDGAHKVRISDSGQLAFRAEGNLDCLSEQRGRLCQTSFLTAVTMVDFKLPGTVEVQPGFTLELGLWMFLPIDHRIDLPLNVVNSL